MWWQRVVRVPKVEVRFVEITEYQCAVWHFDTPEMRPEAKALTQGRGVMEYFRLLCGRRGRFIL